MIRLLNSAMMPVAGTYKLFEISKDEFITILKKAAKENRLDSYIGYQQNIDLLEQWSGLDIPLNHKETIVKNGDKLLIMKLRYRPKKKGQKVDENDFKFYIAFFYTLFHQNCGSQFTYL